MLGITCGDISLGANQRKSSAYGATWDQDADTYTTLN